MLISYKIRRSHAASAESAGLIGTRLAVDLALGTAASRRIEVARLGGILAPASVEDIALIVSPRSSCSVTSSAPVAAPQQDDSAQGENRAGPTAFYNVATAHQALPARFSGKWLHQLAHC